MKLKKNPHFKKHRLSVSAAAKESDDSNLLGFFALLYKVSQRNKAKVMEERKDHGTEIEKTNK